MDAKTQWVTLALMIAVAVFVIASDVILLRLFGPDATYSRVSGRIFDAHPVALVVAIFAVGVLVGHVLLPAHPR